MADSSGGGIGRHGLLIASVLFGLGVLVASVILGAGMPNPGPTTWPARADPGGENPGFTPPTDCGKETDPVTNPRLELWKAVKDHPVAPPGNPSPNIFVRESWALKDGTSSTVKGKYNLLAIPRARVTGVECPDIYGPKAFNLWKAAWDEAKARFPNNLDVMLGINSMHGRKQDQLHIHLSGFAHNARNSLNAITGIPTDLSKWNSSLYLVKGANETHVYRIVRVENLDTNIFRLVKDHIAKNDMFQQSIAVVSATPNKGFYLLSTQGDHDPGEPQHTPDMRIGNAFGTKAIDDLIWRD